jgi:hypothetical protein
MARFVMSVKDQTKVPMNKFYVDKDGKKKPLKNKRNNPLAERFANETADFNAMVLKHFAPPAHQNMSHHIRDATQCQVGTLGADNAFTCVNINADQTSE